MYGMIVHTHVRTNETGAIRLQAPPEWNGCEIDVIMILATNTDWEKERMEFDRFVLAHGTPTGYGAFSRDQANERDRH